MNDLYLGLTLLVLIYAGLALGGLPGLALDRTGVVFLGAVGFLLTGILDMQKATAAIDYQIVIFLFGFMLLSAQFRLGGFYSWVVLRLAQNESHPLRFAAGLIGLAAGLSALLSNDVVCLAMAPIIAELCQQRHWNPKPMLLALATASNIGFASTIIGNPQNICISGNL